MTRLNALSISSISRGLRRREFSAVELVESYLAAIEAGNRALNAYIAVTADHALKMARDSDERLLRGDARPLEGVPIGVKDMFCTYGVHTQACSRILDGFLPPYESTVSSKLWSDGAVMLGKLNMDEFGMGSSNETSCYGPVVNPYRARSREEALTAGGSSGGSAAAVAANFCAGALGTDTGGSIRQPAALTGIVGMKPTYGRCSRWGMLAFVSSLDQAGPMASTVRDVAIMLRSIAGHDPKDGTSWDVPVPDYEQSLTGDIRGLKIGVPNEYRSHSMAPDIERTWMQGVDWLRCNGAEVIDVSLPHADHALPAYYILGPVEAASNLARYDGVRYGLRVDAEDVMAMYEATRAAGFGREVKRRILVGHYLLSAGRDRDHYTRARKIRTLVRRDFDRAFEEVDAILIPTTPSSAFPLGEVQSDPVQMYLNDIYTVPVNMAGLPAMTIPSALDGQGLPIGLQLVGRPFDEGTLFRISGVLEESAGVIPRPEIWWT